MDNNELDQPESDFEETYAEHSVATDPSDIFRESELHPRVGDEYQAAIPAMLAPSELLKYFSSHYNSQPIVNVSHNYLIGNKQETAIIDEAIKNHDGFDSSRTKSKQCVAQCIASDKKESNVMGDCLDQRHVNNGNSAVLGFPTDSWTELEVDSFLLGLYIFGKNLLQVKRFMESKEMGQLLSFYYGRFFGSDKYRRWADCRKTKGRKCIIGQKLLIGSKQQELFSRLLPRLSEESKNTSVEAYKAFADGRISVEEYMSTLKNMVGIQALVEAAAIGKINKDLTIIALESSRSRPEIPSAKDYCSLTYEEIIKYLTGDLRLSKARSSDLFWDAVWPRLLAKGWHSEKPKDKALRGSKNCLLFLFPGIKKYKRTLLKGDHYFDTVSDVLKKVASQPEVLLLEDEETEARESKSDGESWSDLKPRLFTIVDTGLFHEGEPSKVKEKRSLPTKPKSSSAEECVSAKNPKGQPSGGGKKRMTNLIYDPSEKTVKNHLDNLCALQHQNCVDPVVKRRKLTASVVRQDHCVLSLSAPSKKTNNGGSLVADYHGDCSSVISSEIYARTDRLMIDLNIPPTSPEDEVSGVVIKVKAEESNDSSQNRSQGSSETVGGSTIDGICSDEQTNGNARRQSTRVRPMSTRALEALQSRLSNPKAAKKRSPPDFQDEKSRASRRARSKTSTTPGNCIVDAVRDSETTRPNGILQCSE